ncbi:MULTISPECIES: hypothetical protein [Bacillus]|uniref:hypothetical protein n=1 Tax=Bacillus TaxID=1386 RepID=UPI000682DABF|nr:MULTISPECIES: hypothetical protein [Bacillus]KND05332.1 hypothetical protein ACJ43_22115 [Bacillus paralicheniformis]UOY86867.1 hypothetical protein MW696_12150 [Bacillus glycinifermentans]
MSEIKKPVITKEQAECLENLRGLSPLTIVAALINGYEVEKTPEEKVREFYDSFECDSRIYPSETYHRCEMSRRVIERTLDCLGMKIEGVNA